jgi:hypothetical protein
LYDQFKRLEVKQLEITQQETVLLIEKEKLIKEKIENGRSRSGFGRGSIRKDHDISQSEP